MNLANKVGEGSRITRDSFGTKGEETHTHTHAYTQELHYDFHVCNAAEAIRKKFTGSCWNVLIQVNGKKRGGGVESNA